MLATFTVRKSYVYDDVQMYSSYSGAKQTDSDATAYNRVRSTDEDRRLIERFWMEACNGATDQLRPFLVRLLRTTTNTATEPTGTPQRNMDLMDDYSVELNLSSSFDYVALRDSVEGSLHTYFVNYIISRWYQFANKDEAEKYGTNAVAAMDDVMRKIYSRKKPVRRRV